MAVSLVTGSIYSRSSSDQRFNHERLLIHQLQSLKIHHLGYLQVPSPPFVGLRFPRSLLSSSPAAARLRWRSARHTWLGIGLG